MSGQLLHHYLLNARGRPHLPTSPQECPHQLQGHQQSHLLREIETQTSAVSALSSHKLHVHFTPNATDMAIAAAVCEASVSKTPKETICAVDSCVSPATSPTSETAPVAKTTESPHHHHHILHLHRSHGHDEQQQQQHHHHHHHLDHCPVLVPQRHDSSGSVRSVMSQEDQKLLSDVKAYQACTQTTFDMS